MNRFGFRTRLFTILSLFALVSAVAMSIVWGGVFNKAFSLMSGSASWERVAASGRQTIGALDSASLSDSQRAALRAHEQELEESVTQARRFQFLAERFVPAVFVVALGALAVLTLIASRLAGHLSRQLSRPLHELVGWTERIAKGIALPEETQVRGAPEFEVLRRRMRKMSVEIQAGRERAIEAERLRAFRESARRVAHELKNPLTPIRFAVERLRRAAPAGLEDVVDVLATESRRLEEMARSFSQFGRLSAGPASDVDMGEMARYTARSTVPAEIALDVEVEEGLPMVCGHHDALQRALSNVLLNAVDACRDRLPELGTIHVGVARSRSNGSTAVEITVRDSGVGISADRLAHIWDPYVTHKAGGTGLGLAIAHQTVLAHHGTVSAESEPGRGTTIRFTLPADAGPAPGVADDSAALATTPTRSR